MLATLLATPVTAQHAEGAATAAAVATAGAPSPIVELASHRAVYTVSLLRASQRDGVRGAKGTLTYTLTDRCDGYTVESSMHLDMGLANGGDSEIEQRFASWESKDNRAASFRMLVRENGKLKDSYHGTVTLDEKGAGTAVYAGEETTTFNLPEGTLLSTNHLIALISAAAKGEHIVNRAVMDGSFDEGPYRIAGVVGPQARAAIPAANTGDLAAGPAWPFSLAYFPLESAQDTPDYELTMSVSPNGVARHMVQDFGGFTLDLDLVRAEPIARPPC